MTNHCFIYPNNGLFGTNSLELVQDFSALNEQIIRLFKENFPNLESINALAQKIFPRCPHFENQRQYADFLSKRLIRWIQINMQEEDSFLSFLHLFHIQQNPQFYPASVVSFANQKESQNYQRQFIIEGLRKEYNAVNRIEHMVDIKHVHCLLNLISPMKLSFSFEEQKEIKEMVWKIVRSLSFDGHIMNILALIKPIINFYTKAEIKGLACLLRNYLLNSSFEKITSIFPNNDKYQKFVVVLNRLLPDSFGIEEIIGLTNYLNASFDKYSLLIPTIRRLLLQKTQEKRPNSVRYIFRHYIFPHWTQICGSGELVVRTDFFTSHIRLLSLEDQEQLRDGIFDFLWSCSPGQFKENFPSDRSYQRFISDYNRKCPQVFTPDRILSLMQQLSEQEKTHNINLPFIEILFSQSDCGRLSLPILQYVMGFCLRKVDIELYLNSSFSEIFRVILYQLSALSQEDLKSNYVNPIGLEVYNMVEQSPSILDMIEYIIAQTLECFCEDSQTSNSFLKTIFEYRSYWFECLPSEKKKRFQQLIEEFMILYGIESREIQNGFGLDFSIKFNKFLTLIKQKLMMMDIGEEQAFYVIFATFMDNYFDKTKEAPFFEEDLQELIKFIRSLRKDLEFESINDFTGEFFVIIYRLLQYAKIFWDPLGEEDKRFIAQFLYHSLLKEIMNKPAEYFQYYDLFLLEAWEEIENYMIADISDPYINAVISALKEHIFFLIENATNLHSHYEEFQKAVVVFKQKCTKFCNLGHLSKQEEIQHFQEIHM